MKPWENKAVAFGIAGMGALIFLLALLHHKHTPTLKPMPPTQNVNKMPAKERAANGSTTMNALDNLPGPPTTSEPSAESSQPTAQNNNGGQPTNQENTKKQENNTKQSKPEATHHERHYVYHRPKHRAEHRENHKTKHHEEHQQEYSYKKQVIPSPVINQLSNGNVACSANGCTLILSNGENIKPMQTYHGYLIKSITLSHITVQDSKGNTRRISIN